MEVLSKNGGRDRFIKDLRHAMDQWNNACGVNFELILHEENFQSYIHKIPIRFKLADDIYSLPFPPESPKQNRELVIYKKFGCDATHNMQKGSIIYQIGLILGFNPNYQLLIIIGLL